MVFGDRLAIIAPFSVRELCEDSGTAMMGTFLNLTYYGVIPLVNLSQT